MSEIQQSESTILDSFENGELHFDQFLLTALANPKDRFIVIKLEQDFEQFLNDSKLTRLEIPTSNSYHRLIIHRVAQYFLLNHTSIDAEGKKIVFIEKNDSCRMPPLRLYDLVEKEQPENPNSQNKPLKILRKSERSNSESNSSNPSSSVQNSTNNSVPSSPSLSLSSPSLSFSQTSSPTSSNDRSLEKREEEYAKARARIFGDTESSSNDLEPISQPNVNSNPPKMEKKKKEQSQEKSVTPKKNNRTVSDVNISKLNPPPSNGQYTNSTNGSYLVSPNPWNYPPELVSRGQPFLYSSFPSYSGTSPLNINASVSVPSNPYWNYYNPIPSPYPNTSYDYVNQDYNGYNRGLPKSTELFDPKTSKEKPQISKTLSLDSPVFTPPSLKNKPRTDWVHNQINGIQSNENKQVKAPQSSPNPSSTPNGKDNQSQVQGDTIKSTQIEHILEICGETSLDINSTQMRQYIELLKQNHGAQIKVLKNKTVAIFKSAASAKHASSLLNSQNHSFELRPLKLTVSP